MDKDEPFLPPVAFVQDFCPTSEISNQYKKGAGEVARGGVREDCVPGPGDRARRKDVEKVPTSGTRSWSGAREGSG